MYKLVEIGSKTAEICWRVWGTPANFNRFRILAALLHGTLVVGVSQTVALNRGRDLYSAGRPSRWALAHISSWKKYSVFSQLLNDMQCNDEGHRPDITLKGCAANTKGLAIDWCRQLPVDYVMHWHQLLFIQNCVVLYLLTVLYERSVEQLMLVGSLIRCTCFPPHWTTKMPKMQLWLITILLC